MSAEARKPDPAGDVEDSTETEPRPLMTDYDNVKEYVDKVDHDVPEERRDFRAGETAEDRPIPPQGEAPPDPGA